MKRLPVFAGLLLALVSPLAPASANEFFIYFNTYTGPKSKGIYVSKFETATGKLTEPELAAETKSPSFLAVHPNRRFLYAVGEINNFEGKHAGAVSAFSIEAKTGKLKLLNQQASGG